MESKGRVDLWGVCRRRSPVYPGVGDKRRRQSGGLEKYRGPGVAGGSVKVPGAPAASIADGGNPPDRAHFLARSTASYFDAAARDHRIAPALRPAHVDLQVMGIGDGTREYRWLRRRRGFFSGRGMTHAVTP